MTRTQPTKVVFEDRGVPGTNFTVWGCGNSGVQVGVVGVLADSYPATRAGGGNSDH